MATAAKNMARGKKKKKDPAYPEKKIQPTESVEEEARRRTLLCSREIQEVLKKNNCTIVARLGMKQVGEVGDEAIISSTWGIYPLANEG